MVTTTATVSWAPFWVALAAGDFKNQGIDVDYKLVPNNALAAAMIAGQGDISVSAVPVPLLLAKSGRETQLLYNMVEGVSFVLGRSSVKSLKDCKTVVTTLTGSTSFAWTVLLKELFHASFQIVELGEVDLVPPALLSGRGDCASLNYAGLAPLLRDHSDDFHVVFDSTKEKMLPSNWPGSVSTGAVWGLASTIADKRDVIVRFFKGLEAGRERVETTDPAKIVKLLRSNPDFAPIPDNVLTETYALARPTVSPDKGIYTKAGFEVMMRWAVNAGITGVGLDDREWSFARRTDMSLLKDAIK